MSNIVRLYKKIILTYTLKVETGLHIGDSKDSVEIGGVDNPIVRDANGIPYIPGSSLKGKIRCLLEQATGDFDDFKTTKNNRICKLMGSRDTSAEAKDGFRSALLVRDAKMSETSKTWLLESEYTDLPFTEVKFENVINRYKGVAEHPRQQERVPAGTEFDLELVLNIYAEEEKQAQIEEALLLETLEKGIELLQEDYLGGSGSRGYGKVSLSKPTKTEKTYQNLFA